MPGQEAPWRDLQVRLEGPVVGGLPASLRGQWASQKGAADGAGPTIPAARAPTGPHVVRAIGGLARRRGVPTPLYVTLISAIRAAESEVLIANAYFVPHPELLAALEAAARRGVDVKLVLPSKSDNWLVYHAGRATTAGCSMRA